jgi:hypothetical protein
MAKAAPKQPQDININLMPSKEAPEGAGGFLHWALTVGRVLIIVTEVVALVIFGLSILLTQQKNDLKEDIERLSAQVDQEAAFEKEFRNVQSRVNEVRRLRSSHFLQTNVVVEFQKLLPRGITLDKLIVDEDSITFGGRFSSPAELQALVLSFSSKDQNKIIGLNITDLNSPTDREPRYVFEAEALAVPASFIPTTQVVGEGVPQ